ncbi:hypothetical protein [Clostridium sp.]|uniref:hypothetical protein n=1 Tax=Clostridium sp. TaxID=1506 RepID=UPI001ECA01F0|nr:hypothetical protein [Clostridium sp.]MBS5883867.1 hypothetical protein [Clostridium sp.]MDU7240585.1 hypothetical protein [Clostridium sp.]
MNNIKEIIFKFEKELLRPEIRKDKDKIKKSLSEDFFEFCSNGYWKMVFHQGTPVVTK